MRILLVVLLYALFGLSFTIGKMLLQHAAPFFIIAVRMLIGGICLLGYTFFKHRVRCYPRRQDWWLYAQIAIFGIYGFYSLRAWGLQYVASTKAALLCNLLPFFTALFSYLSLKERLTYRQGTGLLMGFLGTIPLLVSGNSFENLLGSIGYISWPELAIVVAVASLSYSTTVTQQLVKHRQCFPPLLNGVSMLMGGAMALCSSVATESVWIRGSVSMLVVLFVVQIIMSNLICANLHAWLLGHYSATFMAFASFISPLCTVIYGYLFLQETVSVYFFVSFFLVVTGLFTYHYQPETMPQVASSSLHIE